MDSFHSFPDVLFGLKGQEPESPGFVVIVEDDRDIGETLVFFEVFLEIIYRSTLIYTFRGLAGESTHKQGLREVLLLFVDPWFIPRSGLLFSSVHSKI